MLQNLSLFLSAIEYLFRHECYNDTLVAFVVSEALNGETPQHWEKKEPPGKTSVNGLVTGAINSSKGKAAEYLVFINDKKYEDLVFETVEKLLKTVVPQVRAVIYYRYAYLMSVKEVAPSSIHVEMIPGANAAGIAAAFTADDIFDWAFTRFEFDRKAVRQYTIRLNWYFRFIS